MRTHDVADCCAEDVTGLADALVTEIADLLQAFAATGKEAAIDLRGLPMTESDREALAARLGRGEVQATVDVAGRSEVWETAYSGLWWVRHLGAEGQIAAEEIAVTRVPEFLASHPDDVHASAQRLMSECAAGLLSRTAGDQEEEEASHA
jgi:hydrogenase-1 operon protein HyaF